ncbi:hypothetical protein [Spongiimicrobium sp. 3-5]|uniref:hypothetical protein n=1 Tax=Spongiimicrobium sp. 3-5 TaxID=3332596 RepID=UPI00397EFE57
MKNRYFMALAIIWCSYSLVAQDTPCACCTDNHREFDFWVGTWEVTAPDGTLAGKNTIEIIQDGCVLKENWTSATGKSTGVSTNFFNSQTEQWEQLWLDNSGSYLKLQGSRAGNQMMLSSETFTHTDGKQYTNRITWTANEDGTVRQMWEVLQEGEVVSVAFDGLYKKVG